VLNECEGFREGGRDLLPFSRCAVVLHDRARPDGLRLMGEGLTRSAGGSGRLPWLGPTWARRIVGLLALGVAISNADWRERVGEAGGERSLSSVAVSISSPAGGGRTIVSAAVERLRVGGDGRDSQSLLVAVWGPPQLAHRGGEEEQQPGVALRLPLPGQVGLVHRCDARVWLREQMGQTGSMEGHLGATWPKTPAVFTLRVPIGGACPLNRP